MGSFESWKFLIVEDKEAFLFNVVSSFAVFFVGLLFLLLRRSLSWKKKEDKKDSPVPPGKFGLPFVGETLLWLRSRIKNKPLDFFSARVKKHGEVFKTHLMGSPTVVLTSPAGLRLLFSNENKLVLTAWPSSTISVFGKESLLAKQGDEAKRIRSAMLTFLRSDALHKFITRTDVIARRHAEEHWEGKEELVLYYTMKRFALSLAFNLFVSRCDEKELQEFEKHFKQFVQGAVNLPINLPGTRFHKGMRARNILRQRFGEWMEERRKQLKEGAISGDQDFLSYLLTFEDENGHPLTDDCIKDNVLLLLFAGHDTSSVTLTMLFKYLAENPEYCENVFKEQQEIFTSKEAGEPLNWDDLRNMKLSWRAVQETLRLHSPGQGGFLKAIKEFEFQGYKIPKGWQLHWSIYCTHYDSKLFAEPEKFDPDRFEGAGPVPYSYVPFGLGPRMCPGNEFAKMQTLVLLHHLVRRFKWSVVDPNEKITIDPMPLFTNGLPIRLTKRL